MFDTPQTMEQLRLVAGRLLEYLQSADDRSCSVVDYRSPQDIEALFESMGLPLLPGQAQPARLYEAVTQVLELAVRTEHPRFFNQSFAGADPVSVVADWLVTTINTTAATYEMSPLPTLMERSIVRAFAKKVGFTTCDGIMGPGGSLSNLMALQLARHHKKPSARQAGDFTRWAVFISAQAHYSMRKSVVLMGLGEDALIPVPCDAAGQMMPDALERALGNTDREPLAIVGTAGTTVFGAFDPLAALAKVAQSHDVWFHVDGCHGASVLFSDRYRHLMDGAEQADSLAWNPHKMSGVAQQCSLLLVKHPALLQDTFATGASYLFQKDKLFTEYDSGDKTILCGRRADALKLWLTWLVRGDEGFGMRIDHAFGLASHLRHRLESDPRFQIVAPPSFTHTCFWWVPPALRPLDLATLSDQERLGLHGIAPKIKRQMQAEGSTMMSYQPLGDLPNFFRWLFINPATTTEDIDALIETIDRYGMQSLD